MFLAVIALMLLAGFVAFWQYTTPLGNGSLTAPAETYAQNMLIWHQAAMLQVAQHNAKYRCDPAGPMPSMTPCVIDINDQIYGGGGPLTSYSGTPTPLQSGDTPLPALATNWPSYQPLFKQDRNNGWHSFLIRNYDLVSGTTPTTQSWIITYYLAPSATATVKAVSGSAGALSPDKLVDGLVKTTDERSGVGLLQCVNTTVPCPQVQFVPRASQLTDPNNPNSMRSDNAINLPADSALNAVPYWWPGPRVIDYAPDLTGAAAILTRVQNGNE